MEEPEKIQQARALFKKFEQAAYIDYSSFLLANERLSHAKEKYPVQYDNLIHNLIISHLRVLGKKIRTLPQGYWIDPMRILSTNEDYISRIDDEIIRTELEDFYWSHHDDFRPLSPEWREISESIQSRLKGPNKFR